MKRLFDSLSQLESSTDGLSEPLILEPKPSGLPTGIRRVPTQAHPDTRVLCGSDRNNVAREHFKYLEHRLRGLLDKPSAKRVLITSAVPREGKTVVAVNLAVTLVNTSKRVLLINADMRKTDGADPLGVKGAGLAEVLEGRASLDEALVLIEGLNIHYIPAGVGTENPGDLVQSAKLGDLLSGFDEFDWVVIDSPPVAAFADALTLANHVDTTIVVARSGVTGRSELERTVDTLNANRSPVAAVVLNAYEPLRNRKSYYNHYYKANGKNGR